MTHKKSIDELTDDDNRQIYRYAMMPIAYYFYWLLKKGFLSEDFYKNIGNEISECDIRNNNIDVLRLLEDMDCCLCGDDMLEGASKFSRYYAELKYATLYSKRLIFDYYDEIKNSDGYYYCVDFSWDVCNRMYERIDNAYKDWSEYFNNDFDYYEDETAIKQVYSKRFGEDLDVYREGKKIRDNITDEYIKKCIDDLDSMDSYQFTRLDRNISDKYGESLAGKVMEQFRADEIRIFEPQNDGDLVYAVSGGADFEAEHGISFYVRNGVIFNFGYGYDFDDIYSDQNIQIYEIVKVNIAFESISDESQVDELVDRGELVKAYLIPVALGGNTDESNIVYLTPLAIKKKELLDNRLQALMAAWNGKLKYVYKANYYDDKKQFVPQFIYARHDTQLSASEFGFTITVWL